MLAYFSLILSPLSFPSTYPMHPNLPFHHTSHWNRELRQLWVRWDTLSSSVKNGVDMATATSSSPSKSLILNVWICYFQKKKDCSSLCGWHSSKVLQVLYKKLSCHLLLSGPLAKLLKCPSFISCFAIVHLTTETNGGTLPSCWLCFVVLRCVTWLNDFELSPACSDGCRFLEHYSEICDSEW